MRVKRYVAASMREAVALVRAELGPEAVILHTKRFRRGGLFGLLGKTRVEVIAALDPQSGNGTLRPSSRPRSAPPPPAPGPAPVTAPARPAERMGSDLSELRLEMQRLREAVLRVAQDSPLGPEDGPLGLAFQRLVDQDVPADEARRLVEPLREEAPQGSPAAAWVWQRLVAALAREIPTADPEQAPGPRILLLAGPTGVGKTTTLAKLAARFGLLGGKKLGLVTADTYRIAAVEQLRTYAEIIGVPLEVVYTPKELRTAVERYRDRDVILVDTAGRNARNAMHMAELRGLLEALPGAEVQLVLSATTRARDLEEIVARFSEPPPQGLIVTKVDETETYGAIWRATKLARCPLTYLTTGQGVPEDIEAASAERVARLIMGGVPGGREGE